MKKKHGIYYLAASLLLCVAISVGLGCATSSPVMDSQGKSGINANALAKLANMMAIQVIDKNSATRRVFSALGEGI